jgi:ABC-type dipeptide/oligopeptide/nickel transport system permease component
MLGSVARYVAKRLITLFFILLVLSVLIFFMIYMLPGDPAVLLAGPEATQAEIQMVRERLGLDKPLLEQYWIFVRKILSGNLGESIITGYPISKLIFERFQNTLKLAVFSILISSILGIFAGITAAINRNKLLDQIVMVLSLTGVSMPVFLLAIILIQIFSVWLKIFPATSVGTTLEFRHIILPALTLGLIGAAPIARITRTSMIEALSQDYITTAKSFGFHKRIIIYKYALRNALIPVVTVIGLIFGYNLAGAVITETIFAYPGLGRLIVDSIFSRDYPVIQIGLLFITATFVIVNTIVDILYSLINPKIR